LKHYQAVVAWLLAATERQPVLAVWEDLHWADPSTLDLLGLLIAQAPMAPLLTLLIYRPEFSPPWPCHSYVTTLTLTRLIGPQVAEMVLRVTQGKPLPADVIQQIVAKTDGVPLFVEELTKMVLESGLLRERAQDYALTGPLSPLAIPVTLQDALMARLDRLASARAIAQLAATLGREFAYDVLQAVSPLDEAALQGGLAQLVDAELLYQRGSLPQARYVFKHALIRDAAYASLLRSTRQQYHRQIAEVLTAHFPETAETEPELLTQHYTAAGLPEYAIPYWQRAGQCASARSAYVEAIGHLTQGLALVATLPESPERLRHELGLQTTLGPVLIASRGYAAPEVDAAYTRAYALAHQVGHAPQILPVLSGLWFFALGRAEFARAQALAAHLLQMGCRLQDSRVQLTGHATLGITYLFLGDLAQAGLDLAQTVSLDEPLAHRALADRYGVDYGLMGRVYLGIQRLLQGAPSQGLQHSEGALRLAQEMAHPYTLASILSTVIMTHAWRRDVQRTRERAEVLVTLATDQGLTPRVALGTLLHGWALTMQGEAEGGLAQMRQALTAWRATGAVLAQSWFLGTFAEACEHAGQVEEGLHTLDEALTHVEKTGESLWLAELYRLKGVLLGRHTAVPGPAEPWFQQALAVARRQGARWLELRAAMSLSRVWPHQGKHAEAYTLLAPIYGWFTEGFDTADLQEAKVLLEALA
jgi:predicted ATPase